MRNVITDTHFQQRDRMGRLLVFMSRTMSEQKGRAVTGIGVSEGTLLLVDKRGHGRVTGKGPVHVIVTDDKAETMQRATPLTHRGFRVWRFEAGESVDLHHLPVSPDKTIDVVEGNLSGDPY